MLHVEYTFTYIYLHLPLHRESPSSVGIHLPARLITWDIRKKISWLYHDMSSGWWFQPLENISQLGWLFPIYGKIKVMFQSPPTSSYIIVISHKIPSNPIKPPFSLWFPHVHGFPLLLGGWILPLWWTHPWVHCELHCPVRWKLKCEHSFCILEPRCGKSGKAWHD